MPADVQTSFESPQVEARSTLIFVGGFVVFVGVSLVLLRTFFVAWIVHEPTPSPRQTPEPRLETYSGQTRAAVDRREDRMASGFAWIDRAGGRVRIPVARAMAIIAARGSSAYDPPAPQSKPASAPP